MIAPLVDIGLQPTPELVAVAEEPHGHSDGEEDQEDARSAHSFREFLAAASITAFSALISHGGMMVYPCFCVSVFLCIGGILWSYRVFVTFPFAGRSFPKSEQRMAGRRDQYSLCRSQ